MELLRRQQIVEDPDGNEFIVDNGHRSFWYTTTGQIIRWSIFLGIIFFFAAFLIVGRALAKRRLNKNLPPKKWNRWLLNRNQRAIHEPRFRNMEPKYHVYPNPNYGQAYGMQPMPPQQAYQQGMAPPMPEYSPPMGGTKLDPVQTTTRPVYPDEEQARTYATYEAPPGPPPAARTGTPHLQEPLEPERTGNTNPFRMWGKK